MEPPCGQNAGAKQPGRGKRAGKREHVRNDHQGRKEVTAGEDEESAQPVDRKLREQQHRGDQVGHEYDSLERRNERVDPRELNFEERGDKHERHDLTYGDGDHPPRLPTCRRQAQKPRLGASGVTRDHRRPLTAALGPSASRNASRQGGRSASLLPSSGRLALLCARHASLFDRTASGPRNASHLLTLPDPTHAIRRLISNNLAGFAGLYWRRQRMQVKRRPMRQGEILEIQMAVAPPATHY
jgi:hypothetical protein